MTTKENTPANGVSREEIKHYATTADLHKEHKDTRTIIITILIALFGMFGYWINSNTNGKIENQQKDIARLVDDVKEIKVTLAAIQKSIDKK